MSFFIASESKKHTLNSDNKFSILEAKIENSEPLKPFSSYAPIPSLSRVAKVSLG
jgi:hypothetical protein